METLKLPYLLALTTLEQLFPWGKVGLLSSNYHNRFAPKFSRPEVNKLII